MQAIWLDLKNRKKKKKKNSPSGQTSIITVSDHSISYVMSQRRASSAFILVGPDTWRKIHGCGEIWNFCSSSLCSLMRYWVAHMFIIYMLWFKFILGLVFFELVSILFAIVSDYGNEYMTKENNKY